MYIFIIYMMCHYVCPALLIKVADSTPQHFMASNRTMHVIVHRKHTEQPLSVQGEAGDAT